VQGGDHSTLRALFIPITYAQLTVRWPHYMTKINYVVAYCYCSKSSQKSALNVSLILTNANN